MRKKLLLSVLTFVLVAYSTTLSAQYTIGTNDGINASTSYPSPFGDYYKTQRMQFLYRASELVAAGMSAGFITDLSWNVEVLPPSVGVTEGYTVKLLQTGVMSLGVVSWQPGASTVWGPADFTPVVGVNNFVLDVPFLWDGSSNIIVEICGGSNLGEYTKNARCSWTGPLGFNASRTYISDIETDPCGYTGSEYYEIDPGGADYRPQVTFATTPATDCADLPIIGFATSTAATVCPYDPFIVSITPIAEYGITYAWYSSPDGATWTVIPGATTAAYEATQIEASYYRCTVTCTLSGDNSNSGSVFVGMNAAEECICIPTYTTGTTEGDFLSNVHLGSINNTTGALPNPFYYFYSALSTDLTTGTLNSLSAKVGTFATDNGFGAWIDYNQDGVFAASEKLGEVTGLGAMGTGVINFTVPVDATPGVTRMRVREVWNILGIDPCLEYGYGETEDYTINIIEAVPPFADFSYTGDPTVIFTDLSTGSPTSWSWNFGDGGTSVLENPSHLYATNGTFNVCLTVTNGVGSDTHCENVLIDTYEPPVADFSYTGDPTVSFTDLSLNDPTSWNWNFGDGFTSTLQDPVHTYATNGSFFVCLTATNALGSSTDCNTINISGYPVTPVTDFTYSDEPVVNFTDLSTNVPTYWDWTFGDGGTSTLQNPVHVYTENGTYNVCLTSGNVAGADSECKTIVIDAYLAPEANFTFTGDPIVSFTDLSTNDPLTWLWNFDDGDVSTEINPVHTYELNGTYNVCLSVTGAGGSDTYCQNVVIAANGSAPVTDFDFAVTGLTAIFTDLSTNDPEDWYWVFADGDISGLQNPTHTYAVIDIYNVCLTASNPFGSNTSCKVIDLTSGVIQSEITNLTLYPNPAETYTVVTGDMGGSSYESLTIVNAIGQKLSTEGIISTNNGTLTINTSTLPAGSYTVNITSGNKLFIGRFIKL